MKRRSFLAALFGAPMLPAFGAVLTNAGDAVKANAIANQALKSANVGTVTAGILRSSDGRMTIDLGAGTIAVS